MADIKGYVRNVKGRAVTVTPYVTRAGAAQSNGDPRKVPGRPIITAGIGQFPGDRIVPNVFITPIVKKPLPPQMPTDGPQTRADLQNKPPVDKAKEDKAKKEKKVGLAASVEELVRLTR